MKLNNWLVIVGMLLWKVKDDALIDYISKGIVDVSVVSFAGLEKVWVN